jgi:hypothetical protein
MQKPMLTSLNEPLAAVMEIRREMPDFTAEHGIEHGIAHALRREGPCSTGRTPLAAKKHPMGS